MNKLEALVITGKLELQFQGNEQLINEVINLRKFIVENDLDNLAISFGRLSELTKDLETDASTDMKFLYDLIVSAEVPMKKEGIDKSIETLNLSTRTYNCLRRAGVWTIRDFLTKKTTVQSLGRKSYEETILKLKELGFELELEVEE